MIKSRALWLISLLFFAVPAWAQFVEPPIVDNCNRTEDPLSNSGFWSGRVISTHTANIAGNGTQCRRNATTDEASVASVGSYGPDTTLAASLPDATGGTSARPTLYIRLQSADVLNATDGYRCATFPSAATPTVQIHRIDNSVFTQIGTTNHDLNDGHRWACRAVGTSIEIWTDTGGGWTQVLQVTDATYQSAGKIGLGTLGSDTGQDDIRAETNSSLQIGAFFGPFIQ